MDHKRDEVLITKVNRLLEIAFPPEKCSSQVVYNLERAELEPEMFQLQNRYKNITWKELSPDMIVRPIDSILLLTKDAFLKMVPAYLSFAIAPSSPEFNRDDRNEVCEILNFRIPASAKDLEESDYDWWNSLNHLQRTAVQIAITAALIDEPWRLGKSLKVFAGNCVLEQAG